jgi:plastocyanin
LTRPELVPESTSNTPVSGSEESSTTTQKAVQRKTSSTNSTSYSGQYLAQDGVYVIRYTDQGFMPEELQIPKGKTVRFINLSNKGMRIFSDSNDLKFLELNQTKTVGNGETYTFSFVSTGLWSYYNQGNSSHKGTIVVY